MALGLETWKLQKNARNMGKTLRKRWSDLSDYDVDDVLEVFGLRRAPKPAARFFSGLGLVMGGVVVGVAVGMMFAPRARRPYPHVQAPSRPRPPQPGGQMGAP